MVRDPVLLSNGHKVDTVYLEEALKERNIPYYVEKGQNTVPTNRYKEGIVEIVPYTNYYVDKSNWKTAREALKSAAQETKKDEEAPVVFLDMPMRSRRMLQGTCQGTLQRRLQGTPQWAHPKMFPMMIGRIRRKMAAGDCGAGLRNRIWQ